jgi:type VI secretion system protein ImpH
MATYGWRERRSVADGLFEEGWRFSFLQAVHLLERLYDKRMPAGEGNSPAKDVVRFRTRPRLDFPPGDVEEIKPALHGEPAEMTVNVLALTGPMSPMPSHVTELVMERSFRKNTAPRDFLDIFNHRLVALLYRARKKYRPALDLEAPARGRVARVLYAMLGLGTKHLAQRMQLPDRTLLAYSGLLVDRRRSTIGLVRFLADCFEVSVDVVPYRGAWDYIDDDDVTRIGKSGQNQILGQGATLGRKVWDQAARFEVRLGPMPLSTFLAFLPNGRTYKPLVDGTRFYVREELGFTIRLVLEKNDVPPLRLSKSGTARLGWTSWLKTRPMTKDDSQVRLRGRA